MRVTLLFFLILSSRSLFAQDGYEIKVTLPPFAGQYVYLGHFYGKLTPVIDSVRLNGQGQGTFRGPSTLGEGMYFIAYPQRRGTVSFLLNKDQRFGLRADTTQGSLPVFMASPENTRFAAYQDSIRRQTLTVQRLYNRLQAGDPDSLRITQELNQAAAGLNAYRKATVRQYEGTLLSDILKAMLDPEVPASGPGQPTDPQYAYRYTKNHYWDAVKFSDDRMLRTPFFENKLDYYYTRLVAPAADSVTKEIDRMMASAVISKDMEKFMLLYFINRYQRPRQAWGDRVYLHLYERYLADREYPWLTEALRKQVTDKAFTVMATTQGKPAPEIELPNPAGQPTRLLGTEGTYTLLVFWDPRCGHCQAMLPELDSLYRTRWKDQGLRIVAVALEGDGTRSDWTATLDKKKLHDWTHVYYSQEEASRRAEKGLPSYPRQYEVYAFPTLYLLDKDKHIMAKKINLPEVERILSEKQKAGK